MTDIESQIEQDSDPEYEEDDELDPVLEQPLVDPRTMQDDPMRPTFMQIQRRPHLKFTDDVAEKYLEKLRNGGGKVASAEECGVCYTTINRWEHEEPKFARMVKEALVTFTENVLERNAIFRAVHGVKEPVIGGKFKDEVIAYVRRPSDNLLVHMMKVNHPEKHNPPKDVNLKGTMLHGVLDLSKVSTDQLRKVYDVLKDIAVEEDVEE